MFSKKIAFIFLLLSTQLAITQEKRKTLEATRIEKTPKIDGVLNDQAWQNTPTAKNFFIFRPDNGKPAPDNYATEVKIIYNDDAIYIGATLYDPKPSEIPMEFSNRDNFSQADFFSVVINPNDDGQNPFQFIVQSSGSQIDSKVSNGNEDVNWSAVWDSSVKITNTGWVVEMEIPYRAIRFANRPIQSWGINFHRRVQKLNAHFTWNPIDNTKGIWTQYDGLLTNLKNITPPTRLNLYPYASGISKSFDNETEFNWNAGMDIKYGLSDNFTLDATLIPDFSQAGFDDVRLNLGPFEQQFTEQRQFFTEGTELFTKGRLFYSRRIGGKPVLSEDDVEDTLQNDTLFTNNKKIVEEITDYPKKVSMLNAVKVSGRTKNGLGIGFFNAITKKTEATVQRTVKERNGNDTITKVTEYKTITEPFANYNIMVLDYQFNKNSAVSLLNTNVTRDGNFRDANVTGLLYHIETKDSQYNIDGSFKMSDITDVDDPTTGYNFDTSIGKHSGKWRWELGYNFENKDYDPNDLGILFSNNEQTIYGFFGYRLLQPKGIFNNYGINFWNNARFQHFSGVFTGYNAGIEFWSQTKKRFSFGGNLRYRTPFKDFFEPRKGSTSGVYFTRPQLMNINHWGSSDYRKKLAFDYNWYHTFFTNDPKYAYGFEVKPRYRFSNKFSLIYGFTYNKVDNDRGFVDELDDDTTIFGERDRTSYNNTISSKYSFSVNSSLSLTFRHNWSKVLYKDQYLKLQNDGSLAAIEYDGTDNVNFNNWNLDVNYQWQFAPGSQLIALYRNTITPDTDFAPANLNFSDNLDALLNEEMKHTFSLRFVYFIDYTAIKRIF